MKNLSALICGVLFSVGLGVSGMMNPHKVKNFLDITGNFDPSLAFVMGGALLVSALIFRITLKMEKPLLAESFALPDCKQITGKLVLGSALFGIGWAIAGICPGPAYANAGVWTPSIIYFIVSMNFGMGIIKLAKL
ncbi:MAG: YeeE/YedE family protein [Bacteriovoracaceae bacterium]|jgi:uncharacterized protein|nr:YeeE/YedE family protein [Bacteriovoracaceae bacterium]